MTPTDERFEDRLLCELRRVVAERPAPAADLAPATAAPRAARRLTLPRVAFGGATAAAAPAAAIALTAGGAAGPAFAVEPRTDGSVTVEINDLRDADELERKLGAAGVPAVVDYLPEGRSCREPRFVERGHRPAADNGGRALTMEGGGDGGVTRFTVGLREPGERRETLVIVSSGRGDAASVAIAMAEGPIAPCEPVDAPTGGAGGGAVFRTAPAAPRG